jgi:hypothetical protein
MLMRMRRERNLASMTKMQTKFWQGNQKGINDFGLISIME